MVEVSENIYANGKYIFKEIGCGGLVYVVDRVEPVLQSTHFDRFLLPVRSLEEAFFLFSFFL